MANAYYAVGSATPIDDIKTALQTHYGSGNVTVYYETTSYLVFACSAISNKVIKVYYASVYNSFRFYYGDAWSSGTTITNEVKLFGYATANFSECHLVLGSNFFFLTMLAATITDGMVLLAKMTNDHYIAFGGVGTSSSAYYQYSSGADTTDGADIVFVTESNTFYNSSNKLYKQQVIVTKVGGSAEEDSSGNIAAITDLYNISYATGTTLIKTATYVMSPCYFYNVSGVKSLGTALFAEF